MLNFPREFFDDEVIEGFYVSGIIKRLWAAELETLSVIAQICDKYNLRWFAAYGTLLGLVRHQGFIPWDDDIDIQMPREDFDILFQVFEKEAPSEYMIKDMRNDHFNVISCVGNMHEKVSFQPETLKKNHQFPYRAVIDIFVLDYVSRDEDDEMWRKCSAKAVIDLMNKLDALTESKILINQKSLDDVYVRDLEEEQSDLETVSIIKHLMEEITKVTGYHFDNESSINAQVYLVFEGVCSYFHEDEADQMAVLVHNWKFPKNQIYPKSYFDRYVELPFHQFKLRAPENYEYFLRDSFGDWQVKRRGTAFHEYPFFLNREEKEVERILEEAGKKNIFHYSFSKDDILTRIEDSPKDNAKKIVNVLVQLSELFIKCIKNHRAEDACQTLQVMQNTAIQLGNLIETVRPEYINVVLLIQTYCEQIYTCFELLQNDDVNLEQLDSAIKGIINQTQECIVAVKDVYLDRKEIVFYVDRASRWKGIEKLWKECQGDPMCDVYVIALPYYEKNAGGDLNKEVLCDADLLPDYVQVTNYLDYNFKRRYPDYIFIQSAFDEYNYTTSIDQTFYSRNLFMFTEHLIYVPWFVIDEIADSDTVLKQARLFFVKIPGVICSDLTIVQSEDMADRYRESLVELSGKEYEDLWNRKIQGWGAPINEPEFVKEQEPQKTLLWNTIQKYFTEELPTR